MQVNERGRQGRERARLMRTLKKTQALEEKVALMVGTVSGCQSADTWHVFACTVHLQGSNT